MTPEQTPGLPHWLWWSHRWALLLVLPLPLLWLLWTRPARPALLPFPSRPSLPPTGRGGPPTPAARGGPARPGPWARAPWGIPWPR